MSAQILLLLALLLKAGVCVPAGYHDTTLLVCPVPTEQLGNAVNALKKKEQTPDAAPEQNSAPLPETLYLLHVYNE